MICNKCGKENNEGSKFCMWCGDSLQVTEEIKEKTNLVNNPIVEEKNNDIEVNNNKPRKNKGKGLVIALIIVLLLIVGISGFLLGRYSIDKKDTGTNDMLEAEKEDTSNTDVLENENNLSNSSEVYIPKCLDDQRKKDTLIIDIDETKYNNISEYIYQQNNVTINWEYCVLLQDGNNFDKPKYELTETEKNNVLEEMKNSMHSIKQSGIGGACMSEFEIMYERNNKQYFVNYTPVGEHYVVNSNDGNIYKILDKTVNNTLELPESCLYVFENFSSTADSLLSQLRGY